MYETEIERIEAEMRLLAQGDACLCEVCEYGGTESHACEDCGDDWRGFKWRGRKGSITEAVNEVGEDVKPDPVNRPAHYTSGGIECIDAMQAAFGAEAVKDFCLCNAFKYLWRHRSKNGVEDLNKARWYLNRLIREMEVTDDDT
jgi:hypothetical protein